MLAIHSEVAQAIAERIEITLTPQEETRLASRPSENTEAYTAYLKGRYYWNQRTKEGVDRAIAFFEQALKEQEEES